MSQLKSQSNYLKDYWDVIQEFMDANITADKPMTAGAIYDNLKDRLSSNITKAVFQPALSASVRSGKIVYFVGKRRVGYVRSDEKYPYGSPQTLYSDIKTSSNSDSKEEDDDENVEKLCVYITNTFRIINADKYNYTIQKLNGGTWSNRFYYSTLEEALKGCRKHLLKSGLKKEGKTLKDLQETISVIKQVEQSILNAIKDRVDDNKEHDAA